MTIMKIPALIFIGMILLLGSCKYNAIQNSGQDAILVKEISFITPDGVEIIGDIYELDKKSNTILLFHQGGSNAKGEYAPIIPALTEQGYNVLAIDQRSGGQYYGSYNRTLANISTHIYGDGYGYCDAYNNLDSALDFIINSGFSGDKIVWGSSYSASLVIQLAAKRPDDLIGALAFSPASGGSMKSCLPDEYLAEVKIPLLVFRPPSEMTSDKAKHQFDIMNKLGHQTFVPEYGVHGSSMLVASRVGNVVDKTWEKVDSFLNKIK